MTSKPKHIVIDARIRSASTGRPVDRLLHYLPELDTTNRYTILVQPDDPISFESSNFTAVAAPYKQYSFNPLQQVRFTWQLYRLRPDLTFFTMTGQAPLLFFGKSVTLTHDLSMLRFVRAGRLPLWLHKIRMDGYRILFWKGNHFASQIIVPTQFVAKDLAKNYKGTEAKTTVIYEASEPPLQAASEKLTGSNITKPFIFHVGSAFPHKNLERLTEAFTNLKKNHPDLKLVLAGKKEFHTEKLEQSLANHPHKSDIYIPGFITDGQLKWLYENAECYVLPSLSEGFGLPGLEAMAHGCPLVSSNATCLPEVYGDAAQYFDPLDTDHMTNAIEKVLQDDSLKKQLVKNGHKNLQRFSWKKMSQEIYQLITKNI